MRVRSAEMQVHLPSSLLCALLLFLVSSVPVWAETLTPEQIVSKAVDEIRKTVAEKKGSIPDEKLDEELRGIMAPVFDFREMSRRCLGINWKKGTPEERKEFVDLFSEMLAGNYLKQIRDNVQESTIKMLGESIRENKAIVRTSVSHEGTEASIDYRMRNKKGDWKVYDVIIENIGLVTNYRSEFTGIVRKEGFSGLLARLKEKIKKKAES